MKAIILAGGSGTRLWPLSRKNYPKQFLKLNGEESLLQQTIKRVSRAVDPDGIVIMTNNDYKFHVLSDIQSLDHDLSALESNIILEPAARNTGPALALGIKYCLENLGCNEDEIVFVCPSDHVIAPVEKFVDYLKSAHAAAARGHIVTFGIRPDRPETGYGYIQAGPPVPSVTEAAAGGQYLTVERFVEKPDAPTAEEYLRAGTYYWNSGMFMFSIAAMAAEFRRHAPSIGAILDMTFDEVAARFDQTPCISIDYAVMEKSARVVTVPLDLHWNDIGSWDSLADVMQKDESGNVKSGDVLTIDTRDSLILAGKRLVATVGLDNCIVIETPDALLVARKGDTQKVKDVVNILKSGERREVEEHVTTYRPWGNYTVLEEGQRYKIKRVVVNPGEKLSLQMHYHRSEHWVVIKGAAKVTIGDAKETVIHENQSVFVPKTTLHRLENPGKVPLEIIEVQNGEYVGEDDIERFDDVYGRST